MKNHIYLWGLFLFLTAAFTSGFKEISHHDSNNSPSNEFEQLLTFLEQERGFIHTSDAPALIDASEVKKHLKDPSYYLIDIRSGSWFEYGHIKGAVNVAANDLLNHFESAIDPSQYDKIILICYSGQSAAYFTSLLRISGYNNVYSMNWGMSSWRVDFAEGSWLKNTSSNLADNLETKENSKAVSGDYPTLQTNKESANDILKARLNTAFSTPYKESIVKYSQAMETPENYYIIDYRALDNYKNSHLPGSVHYEAGKDLLSSAYLNTLPTDKTILVYGETGQETAYLVAYLDVLGYDAANLAYGANSFMHKNLKDNDGAAFSKKEVNMYPVIE